MWDLLNYYYMKKSSFPDFLKLFGLNYRVRIFRYNKLSIGFYKYHDQLDITTKNQDRSIKIIKQIFVSQRQTKTEITFFQELTIWLSFLIF